MRHVSALALLTLLAVAMYGGDAVPTPAWAKSTGRDASEGACRSAIRIKADPTRRVYFQGFRIAIPGDKDVTTKTGAD